METKKLRDISGILLTEARKEIAKLTMPEESWDAVITILATYQNTLIRVSETCDKFDL